MIIWSVTFAGEYNDNPADTETFAAIDFKGLCEMIGNGRLNDVTRIERCGPVTIQGTLRGDY